jgi:hypothetical protein
MLAVIGVSGMIVSFHGTDTMRQQYRRLVEEVMHPMERGHGEKKAKSADNAQV